jgi:MAF protein
VVVRPNIDETPYPGEAGADYVLRLSREKAHIIAQSAPANSLILSADTSVIDGDQILGKPDSAADATAMLRQLRGRVHLVHTGVTLLDTSSGQSVTRLTTTNVVMRPYSDQEITAYVESGDPVGKAGSYAIQNEAFHPASQLDRCYTNVMGLPMCTVYAMLAELGVHPHIALACSPATARCGFDTLNESQR